MFAEPLYLLHAHYFVAHDSLRSYTPNRVTDISPADIQTNKKYVAFVSAAEDTVKAKLYKTGDVEEKLRYGIVCKGSEIICKRGRAAEGQQYLPDRPDQFSAAGAG